MCGGEPFGLKFCQVLRASGEAWRRHFLAVFLQSTLGPVGRRSGLLFACSCCKLHWGPLGIVAVSFSGGSFAKYSGASGASRPRTFQVVFLQSILLPMKRRGGELFGVL